MGFLETYDRFRANRAKAAEERHVSEQNADALRRKNRQLVAEGICLAEKKQREITDFLATVDISSESIDSYANSRGYVVERITPFNPAHFHHPPVNHSSVAIRESRFSYPEEGAHREMVLGDAEYLKAQGMVALVGAQRQEAVYNVTESFGRKYCWSNESVYYGIPVRRV